MDNNVVNSLTEALVRVSLISFKFNFRGVGGSQGQFDQGIGEQEDVDAAISFVSGLPEVDPAGLGLAGYSAGSGFALPVAVRDARIKALAAISPPITSFDFESLRDCPKPKLLVSGDNDDFTPAGRFLELCRNLSEPKECLSIAGADHFWRGYESGLADKVAEFFKRALG